MKTKQTILAMAISSAFAGSVQAQTLTTEKYMEKKFTKTGIISAWGRGYTGTGIKIAVLDSGFDIRHSDLLGQVQALRNFNEIVTYNTNTNPNNFRSNLTLTTTWSSHGTQMASIIAGRRDGYGTVGVAPDARLLLAQVGQGIIWNSTQQKWVDNGGGISTTAILQALSWAESMGATVANMSLGSTYDATFQKGVAILAPGVYKSPIAYGTMYGNSQETLQSYANATKNIVMVAAAGNQGLPYAQFPGAFATQVDKNGKLLLGGRMLIVGSVNDKNQISSFSNRAGSLCSNVVGASCKDSYYVKDFYVVAPGESLYGATPNQIAAGNKLTFSTGTSPATAYVSGGVALIKQAWPQLSGAQIVSLVKETATDLGAPGVDEVYGNGLVNFDRATQPKGTLRMAMVAPGVVAGSTSLASTGTAVSGTAGGITASTVLSTVQTVDDIGRHYAVNINKATMANRVQTYQFSNAWLALAPNGYREVTASIGQDYSVKFMQTETGMANELNLYSANTTYSFQVGSMTEKNGFLGNYGQGAMSFGDSNTTYAQIGLAQKFTDTQIFASYGSAVTQPSNGQASMVQFNGTIHSATWKVGISHENIFFKDSTRDKVSLSLINPVTVRRGSATVTAITDYKFNELADGTVEATPVVTSETLSLRPMARPVDLVLGYTVLDRQGSRLAVNLARQFNVAGQAGASASGAGLLFTKLF